MTGVICFIRNKCIILTYVNADKGVYRRTGHTVFLSWLNHGHKTNLTTVESVQQEHFCNFTADSCRDHGDMLASVTVV